MYAYTLCVAGDIVAVNVVIIDAGDQGNTSAVFRHGQSVQVVVIAGNLDACSEALHGAAVDVDV